MTMEVNMKIGLYDVDSRNFPNLPLMKISAYHKNNGGTVERWSSDGQYSTVYASKVFTESQMITINNTRQLVTGGSGIDLENKLPEIIEHQTPDYTLYPQYDFALGFLTRGCPRVNHEFCITPKKDGCKSIKVADLSEFWTGQKNIVLLDQNLLACKERMELIEQMSESKASIELNGGTDARFLNDEVIAKLRQVKIKDYHFAWDDPREDMLPYFRLFVDSKIRAPGQTTVYVLVNYWSTHEEDLYRIYKLRELGLIPYVMVYDKQKFVNSRGRLLPDVTERYTDDQIRHFKICQHMQRWCNSLQKIIKIVPDFNDYEPYLTWKRGKVGR